MNIWQFRKILRPILEPLSPLEQALVREEEDEACQEFIDSYVKNRAKAVDMIISVLPYKDTATVIKI